MPFPFEQQHFADDTARLFTMRTTDFVHFTAPALLNPKENTPSESLGRMIDPFILNTEEGYHPFFKQNGVSCSFSRDMESWTYLRHTQGGENACVLPETHGNASLVMMYTDDLITFYNE